MPESRVRGGAVRPIFVALAVLGAINLTACSTPDTGAAANSGATTGSAPGESAPGTEASGNNLLARLRSGGTVVVIRHAATDRTQQDVDERGDGRRVDFGDCATQRNLSDQGRSDGRSIGMEVRDLGIPVADVWASPYCRSKETADLAFGRAEVVPGLERLYPQRDEVADRALSERIREQWPAGGEPNLVIVSHGVYPSVLAPAVTLGEGEAAVYGGRGDAVELLGRLTPGDWSKLE
ncbi:hypothetical protein GCM10011609_76230 [Lentzea pudingi]|uniref:Broad specificity phosphatase PhoE n=1 Tax=Lentzea pudingi TaxID=1789439 RepID=A0ABQ2IPW6_9PSEU|nr:histidine phosphatase family protein [Lentzea pudingi]GGN23410.1 hypothetical protein GCM10011609_76230 [Lentzea pudingi]